MQQSEMLLYALNLGFFILGFAIYTVAYGVCFTLQGLPIVTWISNFKQQTIVGGQYFNVPKPTEFWIDHINPCSAEYLRLFFAPQLNI